jgi:serine/threonine-protein kinase ULK/ATG1
MADLSRLGNGSDCQVGPYTVTRLLGAGSFASVYYAKDQSTGQQVALKAIKTRSLTTKIISNLELEIKILKQLRHPHIVSLLDVMVSTISLQHLPPQAGTPSLTLCRNQSTTCISP